MTELWGMDVHKRVQSIQETYVDHINLLAESIFRTEVRPFCIGRRWTFYAGMGSWVFYDYHGIQVDPDHSDRADDKGLTRIASLLSVEIGNGECLGSLMPDYDGE